MWTTTSDSLPAVSELKWLKIIIRGFGRRKASPDTRCFFLFPCLFNRERTRRCASFRRKNNTMRKILSLLRKKRRKVTGEYQYSHEKKPSTSSIMFFSENAKGNMLFWRDKAWHLLLFSNLCKRAYIVVTTFFTHHDFIIISKIMMIILTHFRISSTSSHSNCAASYSSKSFQWMFMLVTIV